MWILPLTLLLLSLNQVKVAYDLHRTLASGTPGQARIVELEISNRADVTLDYVVLAVAPDEGSPFTTGRLALPHSLAPQLKGLETVPVRVLSEGAQEVIIEPIARPQWRIAAINAVMSFVGFVLFAVGVAAWNRYLARRGDPAERDPAQVAALEAGPA